MSSSFSIRFSRRLAKAAILSFSLIGLVHAAEPEFDCSGAPGTELAGTLQGNTITILGDSGNVRLTGEGGCAQPGAGVPNEDRLGVGSWPNAPLEPLPAASMFSISAPTLNKIILPTGPSQVVVRYELRSGQTVYPLGANDNWVPFTVPLLTQQSFSGVPVGTYSLHLAAKRGATAIAVDPSSPLVTITVEAGAPPPQDPPPAHWSLDYSKTFQQQFGRTFQNGTGGNREMNISTIWNESSLTNMTHGVKSFKFNVVATGGGPTYGRLGGITGSGGGTPWFFISEGSPGDLKLLRSGGNFSYQCATVNTGVIGWMIQGTSIPPNSIPAPATRCVLDPSKTYYLNVLFFNLQNLINNPTAYHTHNTCTRNPAAATDWVCQARFNGGHTQSLPDEPMSE